MDISAKTAGVDHVPHQALLAGVVFLPDATVVVTPVGVIEAVNERVLELLGWTSDEIVGRRFDELIDAAVVSMGAPSWAERLARGDVPDRAELALRRDGAPTLPVDVRFAEVPTTVGARYLLALRDATRSVRQRETLRRREAILEAVAYAGERLLRDDWSEGISGVLERLGRATDVSRVYVYAVSESGETMSQRHEWVASGIRSFAGDPLAEGVGVDDPIGRRWIERLRAGMTIHGRVRDFSPDERALLSMRELEAVVLVPILTGDDLWGFLGFDDCVRPRLWSVLEVGALRIAAAVLGSGLVQQVHRAVLADSEQAYARAYDRERRVSQELRTIDSVKDALLQTVSEELRTPLAALLSFTEVLRQPDTTLNDDETTMLLERLHETATRMDDRLRNLLDVERVTRGGLRPEPRRVLLEPELHAAIARCDALRGRPVEVADAHLAAAVDPEQLRRMLDVLLRNASRHTPPGTPVWIAVEATGEGQVELRVDDAGPGVPDHLKLRLFRTPHLQDPQVVSATGLPLVAWLSVLNGGRAWVQDRPGGGASFRVSLPAA